MTEAAPMLSRVAERVYWMARYLERSENTARLINVTTSMMLDLPVPRQADWGQLIDITAAQDFYTGKREDEQTICRFLIGDANNPGSIVNSLRQARENARTIRDIMPRQAWEHINSAFLYARSELNARLSRSARDDRLRELIGQCHRINGLLAGSMIRDHAFEFIRLGINLERSDMTTRIIDVRAMNVGHSEAPALLQAHWRNVLRSLSADSGYRRRQQATIERRSVLDFLLFDPQFPRSVGYCLNELADALKALPRNRRVLGYCRQASDQIRNDSSGTRSDSSLSAFMDRCQVEFAHIHELISKTYFRLDGPRQVQTQSQ